MYTLMHGYFDTLNDYAFELYDKWGVDWRSPFEFDKLNLLYAFLILNAISILLFTKIEEPLNHYIRRSNFLIKNKPRNPENESAMIK
jgi:hypothetical protein